MDPKTDCVLTNRDVIHFYAKSNEDCPETDAYLQWANERGELVPKNGNYLDFAYSLAFFGELYGIGPEDRPKNPAWLQKLDVNVVPVLPNGQEQNGQGQGQEKEKPFFLNPQFQKWHLIVSWYALREFQIRKGLCDGPRGTDAFLEGDAAASGGIFQNIKCREMLLWMYESAYRLGVRQGMETELELSQMATPRAVRVSFQDTFRNANARIREIRTETPNLVQRLLRRQPESC